METTVIFAVVFLGACLVAVTLGPRRSGRFPIAVPAAALGCLLLFLSPAPARADIYQWEDSQGTIHFTDDATTIPAKYRKNASKLIREAPSVISPEETYPSPESMPTAPMSGLTAEEEAVREAGRKEDLVSRVEQQKAKIAAKEEHIRAVDAKRSLATNPLRNRFVDQADMDLYAKYKEELPGDRERLRELETRLESIR